MLVEEVDHLGEREDSGIPRKRNSHRCHDDKKRLHVVCDWLRRWRTREKREAKVDKDEIFCELSEGGEDVFRRALGPPRHGVVGVMLEGDSAEEERDDAGHAETI